MPLWLRGKMQQPAIKTGFFDQAPGVSLMAADPATGGLGMDKGFTLKLFGVAVGMMFMAPSLGGWIADRLIGPYRAVVIGCVGLAGANFLLSAAGTGIAHTAGTQFIL